MQNEAAGIDDLLQCGQFLRTLFINLHFSSKKVTTKRGRGGARQGYARRRARFSKRGAMKQKRGHISEHKKTTFY